MKVHLVFFWIILFILASNSIEAQTTFPKLEESLAYHCDIMANASESKHRFVAMEKFNASFYEVLSQKGSFDYPFDSLKWISKKSPVDKSFRIFTWEVRISDDLVNYFGVLQTKDEKTFILNDAFKSSEGLGEEEFSHKNWLGAVYYNLMEIQPEKEGKYYLLFGINRWSKFETVKLVDVLFFTKEGIPFFGKPVFKKTLEGAQDILLNRLVFRYASDAVMTVNYNPGMEMIVYDNLIRKMSRIPGQSETLVPDGSYVGYEWKNNIWVMVDKIATEIMDTAPRPKPVLDKRKGKKIFGN